MNEILYKLNPWWEKDPPETGISRPNYLKRLIDLLPSPEIVLLTGLRRVGKTTLLKQIISHLLENTAPERLFYVSLDAYGLEKYSIHDIVTQYRTTHRLERKGKCTLFLDEVAAKSDFQRELKDFYDHEHLKIIASASSASVLRDKKAYLTGRTRTIEVLPLDFDEYLKFKKIEVKPSDHYLLGSHFTEYMETGGLPEYVLNGDITYLSELIDNILYKDIVALHNIKDAPLVRDFFRLLMERAGKMLTLNKISKILGISVDTVRRYLAYFEETYLIYTIERCGKLNERLRSGKKIYAGDVGLKNLITGFRDKGAVFENLVFLRIKDRRPCFVYQDGQEIDFLFDGQLMEVKFGQSLKGKQADLFAKFPAKKKLVVSDWEDFLAFAQNIRTF